MSACESCILVKRRDEGKAPFWDSFFRTRFFDLVHCNETSLVGWLVLVHREHIMGIQEMSAEAGRELGALIRAASKALTEVTECEKTYVMQFAEAEGHGHVHFHIVPRMADIDPANKGPNVFNHLRGSDVVGDAVMDEVTQRVKDVLVGDDEVAGLLV